MCVGGRGRGEECWDGVHPIHVYYTKCTANAQSINQFSKGVISNAGELIDRCLVVQKWRQAHCIGEFVFLDNLPAKSTMPAKRVANKQDTS